MKIIINPATQKVIEATVKNLPQSLLITGPDGIGLSTVAKYIADLVNVTPIMYLPEKEERVDIEKGIINVDIIRRLSEQIKTKSTSPRIYIIDYAERMTVQAQNAFLKILEEPGINVYFILVSHSTSKLLPTILSRTETIDIKPISKKQTDDLLNSLKITDAKKRIQLLFMAEGLPAEIIRLISDEEYFNDKSQVIRDARELLQGRVYQKLLLAQKYKDDRQKTLAMLISAANILNKSILDNPQTDNLKLIDKLLTAYEKIEANGNIRLQLARIFI